MWTEDQSKLYVGQAFWVAMGGIGWLGGREWSGGKEWQGSHDLRQFRSAFVIRCGHQLDINYKTTKFCSSSVSSRQFGCQMWPEEDDKGTPMIWHWRQRLPWMSLNSDKSLEATAIWQRRWRLPWMSTEAGSWIKGSGLVISWVKETNWYKWQVGPKKTNWNWCCRKIPTDVVGSRPAGKYDQKLPDYSKTRSVTWPGCGKIMPSTMRIKYYEIQNTKYKHKIQKSKNMIRSFLILARPHPWLGQAVGK